MVNWPIMSEDSLLLSRRLRLLSRRFREMGIEDGIWSFACDVGSRRTYNAAAWMKMMFLKGSMVEIHDRCV